MARWTGGCTAKTGPARPPPTLRPPRPPAPPRGGMTHVSPGHRMQHRLYATVLRLAHGRMGAMLPPESAMSASRSLRSAQRPGKG
eukprot:2203846-Rhodomonas_salina.1